jgi:hypothetical protein
MSIELWLIVGWTVLIILTGIGFLLWGQVTK